MAGPDFTKAYWQSFALICVLLFPPLARRAAGGVLPPTSVDDQKEMVHDLPPPELARMSFNVVAVSSSSDGPRSVGTTFSQGFMQDQLNAGSNAVQLSAAGTTAAVGDLVACRRPMVEIIALIMDDIDGEDPGNLFGRVEVTDVKGRQSIYFRDDEHWEYMYPGKPASLTGPPRPISAKGNVTVHLNLWDADFSAGNSNDHIIEKTFDIWGGAAMKKKEYGKRQSVKVTGDRGAATLEYMVLCNAVAAKINATLIRGNDGVEDEVFGQIGARIADTEVESLVFNRARNNYTSLRYNVTIPLSRTLVAVPSSTYLQLVAKLYDRDFTSEDDEIIAGCAYFPAKATGTQRKRITADSGEIEVKVTWI